MIDYLRICEEFELAGVELTVAKPYHARVNGLFAGIGTDGMVRVDLWESLPDGKVCWVRSFVAFGVESAASALGTWLRVQRGGDEAMRSVS